MWGFFVLTMAGVLLLGVRAFRETSARTNWPEIQKGRERQIRQIISSAFYEKIRGLLDLAIEVRSDRGLLENLSVHSPEDGIRAFERLEERRPSQDLSIDIVDAAGNVVLWTGKSGNRNGWAEHPEIRDTLVVLTKSNLHTVLSVAVGIPEKFVSVVVSRSLEVNYPLSNRFVSPSSFAKQLSEQLGLNVQLVLDTSVVSVDNLVYRVPLRDFRGNSIGAVAVAVPTVESEILVVETQIMNILSAVAGTALLILVMLLAMHLSSRTDPYVQAVLLSFVLWGLRYGWLFLEFPRRLIGGSLFDPVFYGTPFGYGLTSSIGETLLTVGTLCVNAVLVSSLLIRWHSASVASKRSNHHPVYVAFTVPLAAFVLWMTHGFGEAMRSFVFDSTLQFHDPALLFPPPLAVMMHVNIALLTFSYFSLVVALVVLIVHSVVVSFRRTLSFGVSIVIAVGILCFMWIILQFLPLTPKFPAYYPLLAIFAGSSTVWWLHRSSDAGASLPGLVRKKFVWLMALTLMLSLPLLDSKLHQKDREHLQLLADELLRPVDSWLSFVIQEGLRVASGSRDLVTSGLPESQERRSDVAFALWSQALLGREGYNSAIVLYDVAGNEISRFVVGMTSFEQTEMLRAMFNAEEEMLQVVERKVPGGAVKYYGAWSTIRDTTNQQKGFAAVMLGASQDALFRGEAPEPLRAVAGKRFERHFRQLTVSEFHDGVLSTTNNTNFYRGMPLPQEVIRALRNSPNRFFWSEEIVGGREYEFLYVRDDNRQNSVLALTLEALDIRWHMFNVVKVVMIYAGVVLVVLLVQFGMHRRTREATGFGFRTRLIVAFAFLTILPLFFIGYYNRELATERLESTVNRRLAEDLTLLERRMIQTFNDEEDFLHGMNDDYCETLSSEYGIDFSVYRGSQLKASSRPELYHAAILDPRLVGKAYAQAVLVGRSYFQDIEQVGEVRYAVGYKPLLIGDHIVGVIAVPALYRQQEIDEELARRNAYTVGTYAVILVVVIVGGFVIANRLSRPLRQLTEASRKVGHGDLNVEVKPLSNDEIGELMNSFNEMVKELRQSRSQIARAERELAWKEMAKQVAHEIKNPLTPMKLSMQHLRTAFKDRVPDLEALVERVTQTVIEQIEVLSRIASEFSNFARMPERKFERVDVHRLLSESISLFQEIRGIEFRAKFSDTTPTLVADSDELRRVFINLLRNSVQAMEQGGTISVETSIEGHRCIIRFVDTGPGIPKSIQQKVFEPNFSTKTDGTGLGLAICRKIVEDLNGTIELESEERKGSTFTVKIPLQPIAND